MLADLRMMFPELGQLSFKGDGLPLASILGNSPVAVLAVEHGPVVPALNLRQECILGEEDVQPLCGTSATPGAALRNVLRRDASFIRGDRASLLRVAVLLHSWV